MSDGRCLHFWVKMTPDKMEQDVQVRKYRCMQAGCQATKTEREWIHLLEPLDQDNFVVVDTSETWAESDGPPSDGAA